MKTSSYAAMVVLVMLGGLLGGCASRPRGATAGSEGPPVAVQFYDLVVIAPRGETLTEEEFRSLAAELAPILSRRGYLPAPQGVRPDVTVTVNLGSDGRIADWNMGDIVEYRVPDHALPPIWWSQYGYLAGWEYGYDYWGWSSRFGRPWGPGIGYPHRGRPGRPHGPGGGNNPNPVDPPDPGEPPIVEPPSNPPTRVTGSPASRGRYNADPANRRDGAGNPRATLYTPRAPSSSPAAIPPGEPVPLVRDTPSPRPAVGPSLPRPSPRPTAVSPATERALPRADGPGNRRRELYTGDSAARSAPARSAPAREVTPARSPEPPRAAPSSPRAEPAPSRSAPEPRNNPMRPRQDQPEAR